MRARQYDATAQQFLSRDPLAALSGQPYVYAGGNPVNFSDPAGALPWFSSPFQQGGVPGDQDQPPGGMGRQSGRGGGGGGAGSTPGGRQGAQAVGHYAQRALPGLEQESLQGFQRQIHHFTSNKHGTYYTARFEAIAAKFGLKLNQRWNRERLPQRGTHPPEYHEFVLREMEAAARIASQEPKAG